MKKLLSICLATLMLAGSLSTVASAELNLYQNLDYDDTFTVGDVNGDGRVNSKDAYLLKRCVAGSEGADAYVNTDAADLSADGVINTKDTFLMKDVLIGDESQSIDNGKQLYKLTIGGVDISEFTIYAPLPEGSDNNATYAAELMRKYVRVATGVDLQIKTGEPEGHAIVFNSVERDTEMGQKLSIENYIYKVENGNLNIYGTYRGNMYAVYEILENYLGYRFYDSDHTFIYKQRYVDIPEDTDVFFEPAMKFRYCGAYVSGNNAQVYYFPSRMNGTQTNGFSENRYGAKYGPQFINAHSYGYYWRMSLGDMPADDGTMTLSERYTARLADGQAKWDANPKLDEYKWQPCASSDNDYEMLFNGMIDTITMISEGWRSPCYDFTGAVRYQVVDGQKSMSFSLCDNESYCTCSSCRKASRREGYSGLYIDLANRAVRDLQEYDNGKYSGMRVHCILYNHTIPESVRPDKNLIVFFCGQGCNNHHLGTEDCGTCMGQKPVKTNNIDTNKSLKAWGEMCAETGAEMWYWYYGVTYHYVLVGMPNVLNLYYDIKFMYENCNVRGIYYEGGGSNYNFGKLKEYLAMKMMWEPTMTYEKYTDHIKEYLYMYYGDGYEYLYQYILMQDEAAKKCGTCFISNFDRPGDMYSPNYLRAHYEDMRNLILAALDAADKKEYKDRLTTMLYCFDFLGLSYVYHDVYTGKNATAETKALYEQRYTDMFNYIRTAKYTGQDGKTYTGLRVFSDPDTFKFPTEINFDICPIVQVYGEVKNNTVYSYSSHRAAVNEFLLNGTTPDIGDGETAPTEVKFGDMVVKCN